MREKPDRSAHHKRFVHPARFFVAKATFTPRFCAITARGSEVAWVPQSSLTENMIKTDWGWWKLLEVLQLMWKSYVKRKTQKKELQAKSVVFWRFSQKNDNQWRKTGLPVTTETNWLVSLCPWQVRLTPPIDQPQLQPDGTQRRKRLRWPKDFGGKAMRLEAARNFETSLHYITLIVIIV